MYKLQNNPVKTLLALSGNCVDYLKNASISALSCPFKQQIKESIDFLRTLENIQACMADGMSPEGVAGSEKNLLACAGSGKTQMLFFNISGAEFIEQYIGVGAREVFAQAWHKVAPEDAFFNGRIADGQAACQIQSSAESIDLLIIPAGAHLANIASEAATLETWAGRDKAEKEALESALERILAGSEKKIWGLN